MNQTQIPSRIHFIKPLIHLYNLKQHQQFKCFNHLSKPQLPQACDGHLSKINTSSDFNSPSRVTVNYHGFGDGGKQCLQFW